MPTGEITMALTNGPDDIQHATDIGIETVTMRRKRTVYQSPVLRTYGRPPDITGTDTWSTAHGRKAGTKPRRMRRTHTHYQLLLTDTETVTALTSQTLEQYRPRELRGAESIDGGQSAD
ncbi:hypothetical protein AOLI_G00119370 [Acnodon oligacanthus]